MALTLADSLLLAFRTASIAVTDIRIGKVTDKRTWLVSPSSLQAAAQPIIDAFDPTSAASKDAALAEEATRDATRKDVLALCAMVAKYTDPTGWNALTLNQKIARVRALAVDYRDFRIFVEKNL